MQCDLCQGTGRQDRATADEHDCTGCGGSGQTERDA